MKLSRPRAMYAFDVATPEALARYEAYVRSVEARNAVMVAEETLRMQRQQLLLMHQQNAPRPKAGPKHPKRDNPPRPPRPKQIGKRDRELVRLLLQDREAGWTIGIRNKSIEELEDLLVAAHGALRRARIPTFLLLREHYRNHPDADAKVPPSVLQQMTDEAKKCVHEYDDDTWKQATQ